MEVLTHLPQVQLVQPPSASPQPCSSRALGAGRWAGVPVEQPCPLSYQDALKETANSCLTK